MTAQDHKQPVTLSRDELYAQVWATPMASWQPNGITGTGSPRSAPDTLYRARPAAIGRRKPPASLLFSIGCRSRRPTRL